MTRSLTRPALGRVSFLSAPARPAAAVPRGDAKQPSALGSARPWDRSSRAHAPASPPPGTLGLSVRRLWSWIHAGLPCCSRPCGHRCPHGHLSVCSGKRGCGCAGTGPGEGTFRAGLGAGSLPGTGQASWWEVRAPPRLRPYAGSSDAPTRARKRQRQGPRGWRLNAVEASSTLRTES